MQDVHWSCGLFGYFPTYTLGNLYGRQFFETATQQIPDLMKKIETGDFGELKQWLNTNIHQYGRGKTAQELVQDVCGEGLNEAPFIHYLKSKFLG